MRRLFISMMLLLACVGSMWAADDGNDKLIITTMPNRNELRVGMENLVTVGVWVKADSTYRSMQCDLYLPEGVEIATDENDSEKFQVSVNRSYLKKEDGSAAEQYQVKVKYHEKTDTRGAFYRIVLYSLDNKERLNAKDGEGEYALLNVTLKTDKAKAVDGTAEWWYGRNQVLGLTGSSDVVRSGEQKGFWRYQYGLVELDEMATEDLVAAYDGTTAYVQLNRTLKGGEWNTLMLPFNVTKDEFYEYFGSEARLAYLPTIFSLIPQHFSLTIFISS